MDIPLCIFDRDISGITAARQVVTQRRRREKYTMFGTYLLPVLNTSTVTVILSPSFNSVLLKSLLTIKKALSVCSAASSALRVDQRYCHHNIPYIHSIQVKDLPSFVQYFQHPNIHRVPCTIGTEGMIAHLLPAAKRAVNNINAEKNDDFIMYDYVTVPIINLNSGRIQVRGDLYILLHPSIVSVTHTMIFAHRPAIASIAIHYAVISSSILSRAFNCELTSSIAEFSWAIFSARFCFVTSGSSSSSSKNRGSRNLWSSPKSA